jgi:hypothetical protein
VRTSVGRRQTAGAEANFDRLWQIAPEEVRLIHLHALSEGIFGLSFSLHAVSDNDGMPEPSPLAFYQLQHYCCKVIPGLIPLLGSPWTVLPPGAHAANLEDVAIAFATNAWRRELFDGLVLASGKLQLAGCPAIYLDGSYVTGKPRPADFDACWDPAGVDPAKLDPVFLEFANGRAAQKAAFRGEFFPSSMMCVDVGQSFVDFFQLDRFTGKHKGIISIPLLADPLLTGKVQP